MATKDVAICKGMWKERPSTPLRASGQGSFQCKRGNKIGGKPYTRTYRDTNLTGK